MGVSIIAVIIKKSPGLNVLVYVIMPVDSVVLEAPGAIGPNGSVQMTVLSTTVE